MKSQFLLTLSPLTVSETRTFSDLTSRYNTQDLTKSALRLLDHPAHQMDGRDADRLGFVQLAEGGQLLYGRRRGSDLQQLPDPPA